jgi:hypothetical protein
MTPDFSNAISSTLIEAGFSAEIADKLAHRWAVKRFETTMLAYDAAKEIVMVALEATGKALPSLVHLGEEHKNAVARTWLRETAEAWPVSER